ncbi:MAG: hypothetical protein RXR18_06240 [Nitrososphaeria archaeon]
MSSNVKEVSPEALLDRLRNAKTVDDVFHLFEDIRDAILNDIYEAKADDKTKYETLFNFGKTTNAIYMLLLSYQFAKALSLTYRFDLHDEIEDDLKRLIEVHGDLRKGGPLDSARITFSWLPNWITSQIRHFYEHLGKYIRELEPI